jgi:hypothetical protein
MDPDTTMDSEDEEIVIDLSKQTHHIFDTTPQIIPYIILHAYLLSLHEN